MKVSVGTLLSNCSDADGDPIALLGVSATSANGGTVVSNQGLDFIHAGAGIHKQRHVHLHDQRRVERAIAGTVTVNIRTNNGPSPNLTISDLGNGVYAIRGDGIPDRTYRIQFAENASPTNWQLLGTAAADPFGVFQFIDTNGVPQRFYRSVYP